ncbi:MAG: TatD family hydrolase [Cocleimonas sp.]
MQLIDSHSHIDFSEFDADRNQAIRRAKDSGISDIIVSSTTADRWQSVKKVCDDNPHMCHPAYGLHPMFMKEHKVKNGDDDIERLKSYLDNNHAIAVGEIGLDFFIKEADETNRKDQLKLFIAQLEIANDLNLPVIIHARKSLDIILKHLRKFPKVRGSIHSFSGSQQQAKQLVDLGFYLGFGGPITYDRATRLHKLIKDLPLEALLVETDSPDQPDSNHHQQRNEPAFILHVVKKIAELKQFDIEVVTEATTRNAIELFNL